MLMPKREKHRKVHRGRMSGVAKGGTRVNFGEYGLQALEAGWITSRQIEARSSCHHSSGQAWRKSLDHHLSRQARDPTTR